MKRVPAPFPFFNQNKKPRRAFTSNPVNNTSNCNNTVYTTSSYNNTPQPVTRHHRVTDKCNSYIPSSAGQPELVQRQPEYSSQLPLGHNYYREDAGPSKRQDGSRLNTITQQRPLKEITNNIRHDTTIKATPKQTPVKQMSLKTSQQNTSNQTRVITTSSQGVQYWSQYRTHCHLLFEIYGLLDSQVSIGEYGCQTFMLKTIDGIIQCQFWEIDRKLNRLYRGKSYRVIGSWDSQGKSLKCAKVRESTTDEEKYNRQLISISDNAMKQFTCTLSEP